MKTNGIIYDQFLQTKLKKHHPAGFEIDEKKLNSKLFLFQKYIVIRALKYGKYAIFSGCGSGKTVMQLEWAKHVCNYTGKPVLILAPLAVSLQTIGEGKKFGIEVQKYIHDKIIYKGKIYITNYEQLDNIDTSIFGGIVLDESGILKNFTGKMKQRLIDNFQNTPYKLCCTATPSPNDPMEIGNHAEFLNIMSRNEMLSMYFFHDAGNTSKWKVKAHAEKDFYLWIASWAIMFDNPREIGFDQDGFDLPELKYNEIQIETEKRNNFKIFNDVSVNAMSFNAELRMTMSERAENVAKIVNNSREPFIIWVNQNVEEDLIRKLIPDAVCVRGSDPIDKKEEKLFGFANGQFRILVTKKKIAAYGLNYQHCNNQVFMALDFSFEQLYQSIRRSWRFGQRKPVNIYLITTDTMQNVIQSIELKQKNHQKMKAKMTEATQEAIKNNPSLKKQYENSEIKTENYHLICGDCVEKLRDISDESIHFSIFSPPFSELYVYSDSIQDMGNSKNYKEFMMQFGFLTKELFRVLKQGRNIAVHCMDLPIQKGKEGYIGLRDFSGMLIDSFQKEGFIYHSRVTIYKNPATEMQRTKALGLLHKQIKKDATMCRVGIPDYVLIFRKDGERDEPVKLNISVDLWQKWASPVWMDINYSDTLQFRAARDEKDEKHICPLQLPIIERLIALYSNEGDTILSPFAGIGSEIYQAVKMNRKGIGIELKHSYYSLAQKNMNYLMESKKQLEFC